MIVMVVPEDMGMVLSGIIPSIAGWLDMNSHPGQGSIARESCLI